MALALLKKNCPGWKQLRSPAVAVMEMSPKRLSIALPAAKSRRLRRPGSLSPKPIPVSLGLPE